MSLLSGQNRALSKKSGQASVFSKPGATMAGDDLNMTYAEKKNKALAAKNTTVMTYDELERIKGMCSQTNEKQDYMTMRKGEREDKRTMSLARISKWPNTIHAERERKEYERIKKLEDDEVSYLIL